MRGGFHALPSQVDQIYCSIATPSIALLDTSGTAGSGTSVPGAAATPVVVNVDLAAATTATQLVASFNLTAAAASATQPPTITFNVRAVRAAWQSSALAFCLFPHIGQAACIRMMTT